MTAHKEHRPLSPHLQIYRPQISSVLSIIHRLTGIALSFGVVLLAVWLWAAAYDPEFFDTLQSAAGHWFGKFLLIGWTFALYSHLCSGIRHLFWDIGRGFELDNMAKSGMASVIAAFVLTAGTWIAVCNHVY